MYFSNRNYIECSPGTRRLERLAGCSLVRRLFRATCIVAKRNITQSNIQERSTNVILMIIMRMTRLRARFRQNALPFRNLLCLYFVHIITHNTYKIQYNKTYSQLIITQTLKKTHFLFLRLHICLIIIIIITIAIAIIIFLISIRIFISFY